MAGEGYALPTSVARGRPMVEGIRGCHTRFIDKLGDGAESFGADGDQPNRPGQGAMAHFAK